jgi:hypothetical protein
MIGRMILLALGLSLLSGCGRRDHPTVRQVSMHPEDVSTATAAPSPPPAVDDCPRPAAPHRIRPKRDPATYAKLAGAAHSRLTSAMNSSGADGNLPKTGDTNPAETGGTAPPKAAGRDTAEVDSREVRIGAVRLVAPKTWTRERPPIDFLLAEFSLPRAKGDGSDAQLTVAAAGENDPQSLERLREQLKQRPAEGSVEHLRIGAGEVVLADSSGDSGDASGPFPSPVSEGRYRVLNAMVFVGGKLYFVNCTGPEKTVGERAGEFRAFLQTMKSVDQP